MTSIPTAKLRTGSGTTVQRVRPWTSGRGFLTRGRVVVAVAMSDLLDRFGRGRGVMSTAGPFRWKSLGAFRGPRPRSLSTGPPAFRVRSASVPQLLRRLDRYFGVRPVAS